MTTTTTTTNTHNFLRTIPEDGDARSSTLALPVGTTPPSVDSSVRGLDAGREGSLVSTTRADLAATDTDGGGGGNRPRASRRHKARRCSSSTLWVGISALTVVTAAVVVILVVVLKGDGDDGTVEFPPTASPTVSLATIQALDAILEPIVRSTTVDKRSFGDLPANDARVLAREWMLTTDLLRDERLAGETFALVQRFCLAELYFATAGDTWVSTLDNVSVVETAGNSSESITVPFLTPEASECDWEGVTCAQDSIARNHVRRIVLPSMNLTGTLPHTLGVLGELAEISLANNTIGGSLPTAWFQNDLENGEAEIVTGMSSLFVLELEQNTLVGTIPPALWTRPVMRFVYLQSNELEGDVFTELNQDADAFISPFLEDIWLADNKLTGPLPSWLFAHPLLARVWVGNNQFTGNLPAPTFTTGDTSLLYLIASNNNLQGPLLEVHLAGESLETLQLNGNQLTGNLPATPVFSITLTTLWLQDNLFSGVLPTTFGLGLEALTDLRLTGNPNLGGTVTLAQCGVWPGVADASGTYEVDCPLLTCNCCTNDACSA